MPGAKNQSIQSVVRRPVVRVSFTELRANWRCAASLADHEGMHGTADRLRADVAVFETLVHGHDTDNPVYFTIEVI